MIKLFDLVSFPSSSSLENKNNNNVVYSGQNKKRGLQGTKRRGYCPFLVPGCDTAGGVTTGRAWCAQQARIAACDSASAPTKWALHLTCFPWPQVATSVLCRNMAGLGQVGSRSRHDFYVVIGAAAEGVAT